MTARTRALLAGLALVVAVATFLIAKPGGSDNKKAASTTATHTTARGPRAAPGPLPTVVVKNAKPVGGIKTINAKKGGRIRFRVVSDVADEIHVHGYDRHQDVKAGGSVSFDFPASIDGLFVVELESRSEQIAALKVQP